MKYKTISLGVSVLIRMSCNPPTVSVMNKLSTILKTSNSFDIL